ncbi:hypothetical protein [Candidatus Nitrosocosmicus sp. R]
MKAEVLHRNQIEVSGIQISQLSIFLLYGTVVPEKNQYCNRNARSKIRYPAT